LMQRIEANEKEKIWKKQQDDDIYM
jgi:hypothetical protein